MIAGAGPQRTDLEMLATRLGVRSNVRFLGLRDDIPELMAAADALVLSSAWEGSPNVVLEAMAAALPVVATDVGGVRELVETGRTGFVVPPRRPKDLAVGLYSMMGVPREGRIAMGDAARATVEAGHSLQAMRLAWLGVLERSNAFATRNARADARRPLPAPTAGVGGIRATLGSRS